MSEHRGAVSTEAQNLLKTLRDRGVELSVEGDRLRVVAPRGTVGPELQAAIAAAKAEMVAALRAAGGSAVAARDDRLAPVQERVWLYQELEPDSPTYNHTFVVRIEGPLDPARLEAALARVVERHVPLRTRITKSAAGPRRVPASGSVSMGLHDISAVPEADRPAATRSIIRDQQAQPFDLEQGAPVRASLIRSSAEVHDVVITVHHIAIDGISVPRVYGELEAHYRGILLPDLRATYDEYVAEERAYWQEQRIEERVQFWDSYLDGAPHVLELPVDYPANRNASQEGSLLSTNLPAGALGMLKGFAQQERASLFMVLLASYAAALHRATGQRDFLIGTPLHGRHRAEYSDLVGMFVNQAPLRVKVPAGATLRELVRMTRESVLMAMSDREVPFGLLIERLGVKRDAQRTPLFQTMLNVLPLVNLQTDDSDDVRFRLPPTEELIVALDGQAKFDATVYAYERDGELQVAMSYNADRFDRARMEALLDDVATILQQCASAPDVCPGLLRSPAGPHDRGGIAGRDPDTPEESVASRFARTATRFADRPAVIDDEREITYAELYRQVAAIARRLNESVQDADHPLGVLVPHETVLAPAILGALHAGRPYVPLDASYPLERLAYMMRDAGADTILTTSALIERAREISPSARIVTIEEAATAEPIAPHSDADSTAYLLYTSGSTGNPKAVVQLQGNLVRQADRYARALSIQPGDRVALLASISFDASLMDLFGALLNGAAVSPVDPRSDDLPRLPEIVASRQLTVLHVTPTLFRTLRQISGDARFDSIRAVDLGGEAMRPEDIAFFDERFPSDAMLVNSYGPSEHTFALGFPVPRDLRSSEVPIGWPVGDVEALMLNPETGEEDPVSGVLALCSSYGARGYWNNAEATNAAFSTDPARPGKIIYRTGDVVRRRSDGAFVFLHREDHQLKLRGQRVEPAEIETVLRLHPAVGAAAVHAPKNQTGSETLTACVVPASGKDVAVPELIEYCRSRLPAHMVPAAWVVVESLPLTPSGKVDRRSLPASVETNEGAGRLPRTRTEQVTLDAWQAVLNRDDIGITDDFFSVGGHSLAAVEVVARLRNLLDTDVPLRVVFEHPTIEETAAWIDAHSGTSRASEPIRRLEEGETAPLSFAQERVWLFQKMEPDSATYNVTPIIRLRGRLDRARLATALARLLERHEALRSTLVEGATGAEQRVHDVPDDVLEVRSIRDLADADREHERQRIVRSQNARAFDLASDVPFRAMLLEIDDDVCDLVLTFHHVASDYTSVRTFMRELHTLYAGGMLPELPVRYRDYTAWERAAWSDARLNDEVSFWSDYLDDAPRVLDFPVDRPRTASTGYSGEFIEILIPEAAAAPLLDLAQQERVSVFPLLLAVFGAVLHRHTGQRDLIIGAPATGRSRAELQGVVGMFINQIPVRLQVAPARTLRELVRDARTSALAALTHQDMPFPRLVELLGGTRETGRTPLFQVMLNVLPAGLDAPLPAANGVEFVQPDVREFRSLIDLHSKYDFTLYAMQREGGLHMGLVYNRDLFDHARMEGVAQDVERLLLEGAARPDRHLDELWPAPPARPAAPKRAFSTMPEALRHIALERPADVAIDEPDRQVTWRELLEAVERTARLLAADGSAATGQPVGVLAAHGSPAIIGLLGALMSGRPYVPLDPTYPEERLRFMIQDAGIGSVLASPEYAGLADQLTDGAGRVVLLGSTPPPDVASPAPPHPDSVAYLLYTSGSTGRPKAVMQTHGNLMEQAARYAEAIALSSADRLAWMASVSFDASVMDVYGGLIAGAVIVPIDARSVDLSLLARLITDQQVSVLHLTPTVLRSMSRLTPDASFTTVRMLVLGGEPVRPEHVEYFDERFSADAALYNLYGASEHSFSFGGIIPRTLRSIEIPIGRPVGDVAPILVSADGRVDSVIGELVIGSAHNASGYWNAPEMSLGTFTADPAGRGSTLYRTGDIVRRRADGSFVFVRRADSRMKVRSHRIEAFEVEAALKSHALINDAAVHAPSGLDGECVLTACVVVKDGPMPDVQELVAWCKTSLPSFMVPTAWTFMAALPRTPSGKVDRNSLPAGDTGREVGAGHIDARDAEEHELLGIWQQVLGLGRISMTDDFFALGGHSLNATEVVARVREALDVEIPLRYFFDHPTIAECAAWVRTNRSTPPSIPPLVPRTENGDAALSFSQERLWFLQQLDRNAVAYNMASAGLVGGPLDIERFQEALRAVAMRQESLRTTIRSVGGRPVQIVSPVPVHEFRVEDEGAGDDPLASALDLVRMRMGQPYDLEAGPLFRVMVVRLSPEQHVIAIGSHHTISDMWSYAVLGREIGNAYLGRPADTLPVSYRDYATWQRQWLQGDTLTEQVEFWRRQLANVPKLELPTDFPRPAFFSFSGAVIDVPLAPELREQIQRLALRQRVTPFMTLLAAYNVLLAAYSSQEDIAVGVPIAGRRAAATEALIGTFVNTLVHRNDLSGNPAFTELLQRVRATALSAYANQDAPFEVLVKELEPARDTSRAPFFQVLFNVANIRTDGLDLDGLAFEPLSVQREASQFDMSIHVGWSKTESSLRLTYNTSLFRRETAERLLAHYLEILAAVVAEPERRLTEISLPSRRDRVLLGEWNATSSELDFAVGTTQAFAERAAMHPNHVAIDSPTGSFTYAELLQYAQGITAELSHAGIGKGDRVAILMERSREMLGALLGILGSGAAYIPVDPAYPEARVRYVLEDSGARMIITHRALETQVETGIPVLHLDDWTPKQQVTFADVEPGQPAYVIYTSGSTGKPKGVEVTHGGMQNFLLSMQERPGIAADDVILAVTTISFDIAVLELYLPLIAGARVVITSENDALDGRRLMQMMEQEGVTLMQATPATWKLLIAGGWQGKKDLRVLCGGEPLPRPLADELLDRVAELWNMYGPTETTVWSTLDRVERDDAITVGRPIANTTCYVLGDDMRMKPIGVPGELWIGGAGVANGYVNRPDLTEKAFVDSPFRTGERIYRTGDLVRWRHDGRLEHLGRLDNQVKVRGFRIELGEVESALASHAALQDAVVTVRDDRLIAYVVFKPAADATVAELRKHVGELLPPYMVPSIIVTLDALPLTPNGKVDRNQLPEPTSSGPEDTREASELSAAEQVVADVWASLLAVSSVNADDNFFEIGGHSLLAMEAVALIEERTGHRLEPRSLFFMKLRDLAANLDAVK